MELGAGGSDGKMAVQAAMAAWRQRLAVQAAVTETSYQIQKEQSVWDTKANQSGVVGGVLAFDPSPSRSGGCRFWMIKADFLRTFSGKNLPFFQELRAKHPSAFVEVTISYEEVVCRTHVEKILSISHRWMTATQPDPDGEQLKAIKAFLISSAGEQIELVWIDGGSMPQHQPTIGLIRIDEDKADFNTMLSEVCAALRLGHHPFLATLFPPLSHLL